jgi:hypothetical protein
VTRRRNDRATVTAGEMSPVRLWLGSRNHDAAQIYLPAVDPFPKSLEHIQIYSALNLCHCSSDIFSALIFSVLLKSVKNRVISINKDCLLNNRLQAYYRIPGPKLNGIKDMVLPIRPHLTVTIYFLEFSFQ